MKKKLMNFSMAFIAATLLLINPFGAAAQMAHPGQTWDQEVGVLEKPGVTVSPIGAGQELTMCSDAKITFVFDVAVSSNPKTLTVSTTGNTNSVIFTFTGAGDLAVTFKMTKNSTPLTEQEYIDLGLPSVGWNSGDQTMTCPITQLGSTANLELSVPPIAAGTEDVYRLEMISIGASTSPCTDELLNGIYAAVRVKTMPDVTITNQNLTICDGGTLDIGIDANKMTIGGGTITATTTTTFDFYGEDPLTNNMTMEYQISAINPTTNSLTTNPAFNNSTPITIPTGTATASNFDVVITPVSAGQYQFAITKLTANGCVKNFTNERTATLTVRPLPTISFPTADICEGGSMPVTFTGAAGLTSFTVDYRYTLAPSTNLLSPSGGLPGTFNPTASGTPDDNGIETYTQNITTGQVGDFHFYLHTVSDGTCTSTNPNSPSWIWW
jgi:hypothetical protein